jgi:hypothetical protein
LPNNKERNPNRDRTQNQDRNKNQNDMREEFGTAFDIDKLKEQTNDPKKQKEQRTNRFDNTTR